MPVPFVNMHEFSFLHVASQYICKYCNIHVLTRPRLILCNTINRSFKPYLFYYWIVPKTFLCLCIHLNPDSMAWIPLHLSVSQLACTIVTIYDSTK